MEINANLPPRAAVQGRVAQHRTGGEGANQDSASYHVALENLSASESKLEDLDLAISLADQSRVQLLSQPRLSVNAQANPAPKTVLALLHETK
jgi:hypothetical protein